MTIHRPHPINDDPPDAVLFDHCERCDEHAETYSYSLDRDNLRRVWEERRFAPDRTRNERLVVIGIEQAIDLAKRLGYERGE